MSINTTLNSTVTFTCVATATDYLVLTFRVNGVPANNEKVKCKGFAESTNGSDHFRNGTLRAIAYDFNNNTNITCKASGNATVSDSKPALLLIQGLSV